MFLKVSKRQQSSDLPASERGELQCMRSRSDRASIIDEEKKLRTFKKSILGHIYSKLLFLGVLSEMVTEMAR